MKSITWSKDSHGLFDYENTNNLTTKFQIKNNSSIYRTGRNNFIFYMFFLTF